MNTERKAIIFLGPPGSGKGASSQRLAEKLGIPHVSTGDLIREEIKKETPLGKEIKPIVESGKFILDTILLELLKTRIDKDDCKNGFIVDGSPRTLEQAESFEKIAKKMKLKKVIVINLVLPEKEIIRRLGQRRICPKCKRVYNILTIPPKINGKCDFDKADLIQREDDTEKVIKDRLEIYKKETEPLVEFYTERGIIFDVSTISAVEKVVEEILYILEENF